MIWPWNYCYCFILSHLSFPRCIYPDVWNLFLHCSPSLPTRLHLIQFFSVHKDLSRDSWMKSSSELKTDFSFPVRNLFPNNHLYLINTVIFPRNFKGIKFKTTFRLKFLILSSSLSESWQNKTTKTESSLINMCRHFFRISMTSILSGK